MTTFNDRRRLPNSAALTDDPADVGTSAYTTVDTASIVQGLVDRSGNPQVGTLVPRYGTNYLCESCLGSPYEPAPAEDHPYYPVAGRTPGVHGSIDDPDRAPRNYDPATDGPGQVQTVNDDPELDSGRAEAEWTARTARHREGVWPRPTFLTDRAALREGFGPNVIRVD